MLRKIAKFVCYNDSGKHSFIWFKSIAKRVHCFLSSFEMNMENITIWFDGDSNWEGANATMSLLSFQKSSADLSITLKTGRQYLESVGGSFQEWISTLERLN